MDKLFLQFRTPFLFEGEDNGGGGGSLSDEEFINEDVSDDDNNDDNDDKNDDNNEEVEDENTEDNEEDENEDQDSDEEDEDDDEEDDEDDDNEESDKKQATTFKAVKEKYPNVFKEFPELEKSFGLVKRYEAQFATPEEAKQASETIQQYEAVIGDLEVGNPSSLLDQLKSNVPAVKAFAKNILPSLHRLHPDLFYEAALPVIGAALKNASKEADKNPNDPFNKNLKLAVKYISKFVFDDENVPELKNQNKNDVDPEKAKLIKEREDFIKARYSEYTTDINSNVESTLKNLIGAELKKITGLTLDNYTKKAVINDIFKAVDNDLNSDDKFIGSIRSLLKKAEKSGFTDRSLSSRIKSAFLERGKGRLSKLTRDVLRKEKLLKSKDGVKSNLGNSGQGNRSQNKNRNINPTSIDYRQTSDLDILNDNIKPRGK